jgi:hypothetical protein
LEASVVGVPPPSPTFITVVTLVDRLLHRSELIVIDGSSYRLKEATERATAKAKTRSAKRKA